MTLVVCPRCGNSREIKGHLSAAYEVAGSARSRVCNNCKITPRPTLRLLRDSEWLEQAYSEQSSEQIAQILGCSGVTVRKWLRRHGIRVRSAAEANALREAKRGGSRPGRNRQMVSGRGNTGPGAVLHYESGTGNPPGGRA